MYLLIVTEEKVHTVVYPGQTRMKEVAICISSTKPTTVEHNFMNNFANKQKT